MAFFGFGIPPIVLDEEFDAPDLAADHQLCRAITTGRMGLHPDAWGNHDPLPLRWLLSRCGEAAPAPEVYAPPVDRKEKDDARKEKDDAKFRRPVDWGWIKRKAPAAPPAVIYGGGTIELTCDECGEAFGPRVDYGRGQREAMAAGLRAVGAEHGWTHIVGRDRCPECSIIPAPDDIGNGAGEGERDKQHADGG